MACVQVDAHRDTDIQKVNGPVEARAVVNRNSCVAAGAAQSDHVHEPVGLRLIISSKKCCETWCSSVT